MQAFALQPFMIIYNYHKDYRNNSVCDASGFSPQTCTSLRVSRGPGIPENRSLTSVCKDTCLANADFLLLEQLTNGWISAIC